MEIKFESKSKATQLIILGVLSIVIVAGFASLMVGSKEAVCKHLMIDQQCWIEDCKGYAEFHCGKVLLNTTADEFTRFLDVSCWSHHENTSCSITKGVGGVELYHLQYSPEECGTICHKFKKLT